VIGVVYGIYDEDKPDEVRYIGKTFHIVKRIKSHKRSPLTKEMRDWNERVGTRRNFLVLARAPESSLHKAEQRWIRKALREGHRLFNVVGKSKAIVAGELVPWDLPAMSVSQEAVMLGTARFGYSMSNSWQHLEMRGEFFADKNAVAITESVGSEILDEADLVREEDEAVRVYLAQQEVDHD